MFFLLKIRVSLCSFYNNPMMVFPNLSCRPCVFMGLGLEAEFRETRRRSAMSGHWLRHTFLAPRPSSLTLSSTMDEYKRNSVSHLGSYSIDLSECYSIDLSECYATLCYIKLIISVFYFVNILYMFRSTHRRLADTAKCAIHFKYHK